MEKLKKIEGVDRFLLIAGALTFADIPQIILYAIPFASPIAWMWGILASMIFGFILNTTFDVRLFGPRWLLRTLAFLLAEFIPYLGAIVLLSVGLFIITIMHNRHVDQRLRALEEGYNE